MPDLEPLEGRTTRTFRETDVNGIGDKAALVSRIELMDGSNLSNFHAHVVSIC